MMIRQLIRSGLSKVLISAIVAALLTACGADSGGGSSAVDIGGSVGDGPITGATVRIYNKDGQEIGSVISDSTASYNIKFKAKGRDYPLLMEVTDGFDLVTGAVPDFRMLSVMVRPSDKHVNINPFSTLVVWIATYMPGGMNAENITVAKNIVTEKLGFGLDPDVFDNPITRRVDESNVAHIVKASEALGEMVRRTRDWMAVTRSTVSGDDVIEAIAADMTDGFLDGKGADGADPAIAAIANVVSGQVLVEAMSNHLKVGGVVATSVIDQAISITHPDTTLAQLTGGVRIPSGMLAQARVALEAVQVLDNSARVADIVASINDIVANSLPDDIATLLPADSSIVLDNAVALSSTASAEDVVAINRAVNAAGGSRNSAATVIPQADWSLVYVDSEELVGQDGAAVNAFDGDSATIWHTRWGGAEHAHEIQINMGESYVINGFRYFPRQKGVNGRIKNYEFYVSTDGVDWGTPVATGVFSDNALEQEVLFASANGTYVRLVALSDFNGDRWTSIAEINVLREVTLDNQTPDTGDGGGTGTGDSGSTSTGGSGGTGTGDSGGTSTGGSDGTSTGDSGGTSTGDSGGTSTGGSGGTSTGDSGGTSTGDSGGTSTGDSGSTSTGGSGSTSTGDSGGTSTGDSGSTSTGDSGSTGTGSFSVGWTAPVARADGSPLSLADIDGYRIHYGESAGNYTYSVNIADGTAQSATVKDVPVGKYYVVMTTYDASGLESGYSKAVTKISQ